MIKYIKKLFKKLYIIIASLFFGGALSFFVVQEEQYFYVLAFLIIFNLLFIWPLAKRVRFLAIPLFLSVGALNLLYLVDGVYERTIFIVLAVVVYGLALWGANRLKKYDCDQTAQSMINLATITTAFFWLVANYGWYLNFDIDSWMLVITTISSTFLIVLPSLTICFVSCYKIEYRQEKAISKSRHSKKDFIIAFKQQLKVQRIALFFSFIIAFIMGEIMWGLSFWPFGYLTTGMTAVIVFFLLWAVVRRFIQGRLTKKFIIINVSIMLMLIVIMVITSPWGIIK